MPRPALTSVAAVFSVLAASSCCLPILPFIAAAGLAGGSAFLWMARPYLLGASIFFVGLGFWQAIRAKQCNRRQSRIASALLWISAVVVVVSILFPAAASAVTSIRGGNRTPPGQPALVDLKPQTVSEVRTAFNSASDNVRLLLFLSPT